LAFCHTEAVIHAHEGHTKVGTIDLERVFADSEQGTRYRKEFAKETEALGNEVLAEARVVSYAIKNSRGTAKGELETKLATLKEKYESTVKDRAVEDQQLRTDRITKLEAKVIPILETIKIEGDYNLIINNKQGIVVLRDDVLDITDQVIEQLNGE
jgi:Skp family chaperone for outer membrane proteins